MNVVVLAGGISPERDVSLSSGKMVYEALKENGHKVILLDVYLGYEGDVGKEISDLFNRSGDWAEEIQAVGEESPDIEAIKALRPDGDKHFFGPNVIAIGQAADVVFIALHGESGENGKMQACFDLMGICYTGNDYISSALAMDKRLSKELFCFHGIPTPSWFSVKQGESRERQGEFPCMIKVNSGGSSIGVYLVNHEEEYRTALSEAFRYDREVVVEQYIKGREFSVAVLEGKALPVIEIAPLQGFYDYKNKYQAGNAVETCPARISEEKSKEMQGYAERVFEILGLKNYARMDFMMDEQGNIYCLEANTLPGMTQTSLLPQEAAAAGISFPQLCERIVQSAIRP
jgi:D-alanine-D-alanine ligase